MEEFKIELPKEIALEIAEHPEIDWSLIFKKAAKRMIDRLSLIEFIEKKLDKSEFTEQDALELSGKIKQKRLDYLKSHKIIE